MEPDSHTPIVTSCCFFEEESSSSTLKYMISKIKPGTVHELPDDLKEALMADESALERWQDLTPLARNEWICWTITNKKLETRANHIERTVSELLEGVRRPCCWAGCIHRNDRKPFIPNRTKKPSNVTS